MRVQKFLVSLTLGKLNIDYSFKDNGLGALVWYLPVGYLGYVCKNFQLGEWTEI